MKFEAGVMLGLAVVLGGAAVFLGRGWIDVQIAARQPTEVVEVARKAETTTVVAGRGRSRFGDRVTGQRVGLWSIEEKEPVLHRPLPKAAPKVEPAKHVMAVPDKPVPLVPRHVSLLAVFGPVLAEPV